MRTGNIKVTKRVWYAAGGLANPRCWRKQQRNGAWSYFMEANQ